MQEKLLLRITKTLIEFWNRLGIQEGDYVECLKRMVDVYKALDWDVDMNRTLELLTKINGKVDQKKTAVGASREKRYQSIVMHCDIGDLRSWN